ncbi:ABC transporter permease [Clostridium beijerinckii]|uniref:ABC transporter permease n=1 Tax=Clostridium beijerinckii TaxID=1520 RepID=A0A0B5QH80_CLOBE|nr:ABC transporter permease [Clostridium beijerinckii]AJG97317.1 ABC transporter permease [Clostridium beijerinckii]
MKEKNKVISKIGKLIFSTLSTAAFFVIWYLATSTGILDTGIIPEPLKVFNQLATNIFKGDLLSHTLLTFKRAIIGFFVALIVGLLIGFFLASISKKLRNYVIPILQFFEKLNPFALFPLFMLFFGIGEFSKVIIIFWVAVWPIIFHTIAGVEGVDKLLIKSARTIGASPKTEFFKVILPAALPDIITGIKFSAQIAFILVISAEMLSSSAGLGWFISIAKTQYNLPNLYGGTLFVAALGITINKILNILESKLFVWKEKTF